MECQFTAAKVISDLTRNYQVVADLPLEVALPFFRVPSRPPSGAPCYAFKIPILELSVPQHTILPTVPIPLPQRCFFLPLLLEPRRTFHPPPYQTIPCKRDRLHCNHVDAFSMPGKQSSPSTMQPRATLPLHASHLDHRHHRVVQHHRNQSRR